MKKLILILLIPILAIGQIKKVDESEKPVVIGKAKNVAAVIATMHKVSGEPDYYFVTFNNIKYQTITDVKSFGFKDVDGAFDYLYSSVAAAAKERKLMEIYPNIHEQLVRIVYPDLLPAKVEPVKKSRGRPRKEK